MKHLRKELQSGMKAVFLVNNVALLEQQAAVCRASTGLPIRSYCGADGVDDWTAERTSTSILLFIHDVFLLALSRGHLSMEELALLVVDECHHAVGNHTLTFQMVDGRNKGARYLT